MRLEIEETAHCCAEGPMNKRILIVGGVAGGASTAARLRRLDEHAEIVIFERGHFVSFANCGLPYHVGGVIMDEQQLLVATPALFSKRFRVQVHERHEAIAIDTTGQRLTVRNLADGSERSEHYDSLVLATGAASIVPPIPGIDLPGIFQMRTIPDARAIRARIASCGAGRAIVVGGGFIGLEMAENLRHRGLDVTLIEKAGQLMPPIDGEMATPIHQRLVAHGVEVHLGDAVTAFSQSGTELTLHTERGLVLTADVVVLAIGVRPDTGLAAKAGLRLGARGGIAVDAGMRTSVPGIWAVGDAIEVTDTVLGTQTLLPLAGPANRQGRIAAATICGREAAFRGVQGTAVCGLFGLTVAMTGASEKALRRAGDTDFHCVYLHPGDHAGYYPGAKPLHVKLIYRPSNGRILGAQAVGEAGIERRIDAIAMALQFGATVEQLAEAELCYAPQYGSAKDPVNVAGMIASNARSGDAPLAMWSEAEDPSSLLLDVREPAEWEAGHHDRAVHIPLHHLRDRMIELPTDRKILVTCAVGLRGHVAVRLLRQRGYDARNLSGGWTTWRHLHQA